MNVSLQVRIEKVYEEVRGSRKALHEAECTFAVLKELAVSRHFEELKGARSNEARNQTLAALMSGDNEYESAQDTILEARLRFELAKDYVDELRMLCYLDRGDK